MVGLILLTKLIIMILTYGQLELLKKNSEMYAHGSKLMQLLISMIPIIKMLQIILILLQITILLPKFIWEISAFLTLEIMMVLMSHSPLS